MTAINSDPRLGGVAEVAAELGVSRQQVAKLRQREDFPAPIAELSVGDVWDLDVICRWGGSGLRRTAGRPPENAAPRAVGRRFELLGELGSGGFAVVYAARDLLVAGDSRAAVKVLHEGHAMDAHVVARFQRELKIMSGLRHPNVMPILASGFDETLGLWYAMPLALRSLADELGNGPMESDAVTAIMRQICLGLAYIHSEGILHRDLKPQNVLRTAAGDWAIADFGLARATLGSNIRLTATADAMGSPFYTAPEQWTDAKRVSERADIYSIGKILQALMVGGHPADDVVPSGALRGVAQRAISHDPMRRHSTAIILLAAFETAIAPAPSGPRETPREKADRLRPRLRDPWATDETILDELIRWPDEVDSTDEEEVFAFVWAMSALPRGSIEWWWGRDTDGFRRAFQMFAERLEGSFSFEVCDIMADFAHLSVIVTADSIILREALAGLTCLGHQHNRWHVQDVANAILQTIKTDEDAVTALEGLRLAGKEAAEWTVGNSTQRTLHPVLRAGLDAFFTDAAGPLDKIGPTAFAFRDEDHVWHGEPDLLPAGQYQDARTATRFDPAEKDSPLSGQTLIMRCGEIAQQGKVTPYTLHVRKNDGNTLPVRMTHPVQDALFGPPIMGTPERARWEAAREQKRRERNAE